MFLDGGGGGGRGAGFGGVVVVKGTFKFIQKIPKLKLCTKKPLQTSTVPSEYFWHATRTDTLIFIVIND